MSLSICSPPSGGRLCLCVDTTIVKVRPSVFRWKGSNAANGCSLTSESRIYIQWIAIFLTEDFNLLSASSLKRPEYQRAFRLAGETLLLLPFSYMTEDTSISGNSSWLNIQMIFSVILWLFLPYGGNISWKDRVGEVKRNAPTSPSKIHVCLGTAWQK